MQKRIKRPSWKRQLRTWTAATCPFESFQPRLRCHRREVSHFYDVYPNSQPTKLWTYRHGDCFTELGGGSLCVTWVFVQESLGALSWRHLLSAYCCLVFWQCSIFKISIFEGNLMFNWYVRKPTLSESKKFAHDCTAHQSWESSSDPARRKWGAWQVACLKRLSFQLRWKGTWPWMPGTAEFPCDSVGSRWILIGLLIPKGSQQQIAHRCHYREFSGEICFWLSKAQEIKWKMSFTENVCSDYLCRKTSTEFKIH